MERHVSMEEISDGKLYGPGDMVRADCGGCEGCSACCKGMGQSVVLDPLDFHRLCLGLKAEPKQVMAAAVDLHVEKGIICLSLKMSGPEESCLLLN